MGILTDALMDSLRVIRGNCVQPAGVGAYDGMNISYFAGCNWNCSGECSSGCESTCADDCAGYCDSTCDGSSR